MNTKPTSAFCQNMEIKIYQWIRMYQQIKNVKLVSLTLIKPNVPNVRNHSGINLERVENKIVRGGI